MGFYLVMIKLKWWLRKVREHWMCCEDLSRTTKLVFHANVKQFFTHLLVCTYLAKNGLMKLESLAGQFRDIFPGAPNRNFDSGSW